MRKQRKIEIACRPTGNSLLVLLFCLMVGGAYAQSKTNFIDETLARIVKNDAKEFVLSPGNIALHQPESLLPFFEKLEELYRRKEGKLNIVHIGDSHIQAGFMTGEIRDTLQSVFGNAGLGFTFPHRLARSNGLSAVRYTSSVPWTTHRNRYADEAGQIGLSGYSLTTDAPEFAINLEIEEDRYYFNELKLITPLSTPVFEVAQTDAPINLKQWTTTYKTHRIQAGEVLGGIAGKYGVSIATIKAANNLRSDMIRAGATLKIPIRMQKPVPVDRSNFKPLDGITMPGYVKFTSAKPLKSIWLLPKPEINQYALNGIVLENSSPGITYSTIGVNGARFKDYNHTDLFFKQLPYLEPDLLVISLGTNEAHEQLKTEKYMEDLDEFVQKIHEVLPGAFLILTTPTPMLDRRRKANEWAKDYTDAILRYGEEHGLAVYDLFRALGGNQRIRENFNKGLYFRDYIHYTQKGYILSGDLFSEAFLNAFYQTTHKSLVNEH